MSAGTQHGFTLTEMLVALAILLVAVTSLLGALTAGIGLRRSADATLEATYLAEEVLHRVRQESFRSPGGGASVLDAPLQPMTGRHPTFPGMRWSVAFAEAPERPDIVLCTLTVRWTEEGETARHDFHAVMPRQEPLGLRVDRFRQHNDTR